MALHAYVKVIGKRAGAGGTAVATTAAAAAVSAASGELLVVPPEARADPIIQVGRWAGEWTDRR